MTPARRDQRLAMLLVDIFHQSWLPEKPAGPEKSLVGSMFASDRKNSGIVRPEVEDSLPKVNRRPFSVLRPATSVIGATVLAVLTMNTE